MATWPELVADALPEPKTAIVEGLRISDDGHWEQTPFVRGHHVNGARFVEFPHLCPGRVCAVSKWIQRKDSER